MSEQTDVPDQLPPEITNFLTEFEKDEAKKKEEGEELIPCDFPGCTKMVERKHINRHKAQAHKRRTATKKRGPGRPKGSKNKTEPREIAKSIAPKHGFKPIWQEGDQAILLDQMGDVWMAHRMKET